MGGTEVFDLLEKEDREMSVEEMSNILNLTKFSVWKALKRMEKYNEVKKRKLTRQEIKKLNKQFTGRHVIWRIVITNVK